MGQSHWTTGIMNRSQDTLFILYRHLGEAIENTQGLTLEVINYFSSDGEITLRSSEIVRDEYFENFDHMQDHFKDLALKKGLSSLSFLNVHDFNRALESIDKSSQLIEIFEKYGEITAFDDSEVKKKGFFSKLLD
jgi:hypothetical protein